MLPLGKKSLAQIAEASDPADRILALAILLEYLLVAISPDARSHHADGEKLYQLLPRHQDKFSNYAGIECARWVRNQLVHARGTPLPTQIMGAETDLDQAVREILPHCEAQLQRDAVGKAKKRAPKMPYVAPPEPEAAEPPPPPPPANAFQPIFPPPLAAAASLFRSSPWFVLAGGFLLVAVFAYVVRPRAEQAAVQAAPTLSPPAVEPQRKIIEPKAPTLANPPVAVESKAAGREREFRRLINTGLAMSSAQPNLALLIDSSGSTGPGSLSDALRGFLPSDKVRIITNLADPTALRASGFFDELYAGDAQLLTLAIQLSRVDYLLLGKAAYTFRKQPDLDADLLTCDLTLALKLVDRSGSVVESASFSVTGPGFTQAQALERAAENGAHQLRDRILNRIR